MGRRLSHGEKVGPYTVQELLGSGGEGDVYAARSLGGVVCALKQLTFGAAAPGRRADRERAFRLRKLVGKRSPYVCEILDVFVVDGLVYIAMELVNGPTLEEVLASKVKLSPAEIQAVVEAVLQGLDWLHKDDIIHRDIKPGNIVLVDDTRGVVVKIIDLGIALDRGLSRVTHRGGVVGTVEYGPPEMLTLGESKVDLRFDLYCLGSTMFQALTGQIPFASAGIPVRRTFIEDLHASVRPSIRDHVPSLPESLDRYVQRLMSLRPEDRPQSAAEALNEFQIAIASCDDLELSASVAAKYSRGAVSEPDAHRIPTAEPTATTPAETIRTLFIETGPLAGEYIRIPQDGVTLGRTRINPDDRSISRFHFRVTSKKNRVFVRDCGALNGLIYREHRVHHARLVPGDTLIVGETTLRLL